MNRSTRLVGLALPALALALAGRGGFLGFPACPLTAAGTTPAGTVVANLDRSSGDELVVASSDDATLTILGSGFRSFQPSTVALPERARWA